MIEVVFLPCLIVKSLPACVRVIQTSSLDVDFEDYDVFLVKKWIVFIINVLEIHNYSISLITDICEINIIKNVYKLYVILMVYNLMVRTWSLVFMLKKIPYSPILKLYFIKRDAILAHINLDTITKSNFHQFNVFLLLLKYWCNCG